MNILLATSEVLPFSKTGGLADMVGALAKALEVQGHRVGVVTPFYRGVDAKAQDAQLVDGSLELTIADRVVSGQVFELKVSDRLQFYFIDQPSYYDREQLYSRNGHDFGDNAERFVYYSKAVVHLARHLSWRPELVHAHDWQAGLVPLMIKDQQAFDGWSEAPGTCFTIHNLAYQGVFPKWAYGFMNLRGDYYDPNGAEFYGHLNCLKAALMFSDVITTVSPRYAREIMAEENGCGLGGVLRERQQDLKGILNGVDYTEWRTTDNPFIENSYGIDSIAGKAAQKKLLQRELSLPSSAKGPLFGTITRLVDQKGVDILLDALERMLHLDFQFVLLGSGHPQFETGFLELAKKHPGKVAAHIGYDNSLAHRIEAGSDFYLMPSRYEPCGLNQMYSLRYGTVPVVRATGGLDDSVVDLTEDIAAANGIKFYDYSVTALSEALNKALVAYRSPKIMRHYQQNGMGKDFSWERTSAEYLKTYQRALAKELSV